MKLLALLLLLAATPAAAAETRSATPGSPPPPARVEDLAWLVGEWHGPGIGGEPAMEAYGAPAGGQMPGLFRQQRKDGVWFYEITAIAQVGESLEYRLKHFNADLTGWEEKGDVQRFPLVAVGKDSWFFDGLTIRRDGDSLVSAVAVHGKDGRTEEYVFRYKKVR